MSFEHFARLDPHAEAVRESTGRRWSRRKLYTESNRLAHALRRAGIGETAVVATLLPNCIEYVAMHIAAIQAGVYLLPVNWHLSAAEIGWILADSGAQALIVHEQLRHVASQLLASHSDSLRARLSVGPVSGFVELQDFQANQPDVPLASTVRGELLRYTSATTGRPKAVHRPLQPAACDRRQADLLNSAMGITAATRDVHLCNSPLYHSPVMALSTSQLTLGHELVLFTGAWNPEEMLQLVDKHRISSTFVVPTMFVRLLKLPEPVRRAYDVSSLRRVLHSAAPCPIDVKRAMIEWWGPVIWERYGSVEGPATLVDSSDWLRFPGTVGRPEAGIDIKILDDHGHELPRESAGKVYIRPRPGLDFEYRDDRENTRRTRMGDYYTVGDIGYLNSEGFLFLCDRESDLIISGGVNIYPAEIEQLLVQHPSVHDCAVVAAPHPLLGQVPHAIVQPAAGVCGGVALTRELLAFLRDRVATLKIPHRFEYKDALPRGDNGKMYKRLLFE